jgi:hypothetical protein
MKSKKGLIIWGDNEPFFSEANIILNHFFDGMYMIGDYYGTQIVSRSPNG